MDILRSAHENQRYVVETITMTTVTERRIVREATDADACAAQPSQPIESTMMEPKQQDDSIPQPNPERTTYLNTLPEGLQNSLHTAAQISGILKGGKLWKSEQTQVSII